MGKTIPFLVFLTSTLKGFFMKTKKEMLNNKTDYDPKLKVGHYYKLVLEGTKKELYEQGYSSFGGIPISDIRILVNNPCKCLAYDYNETNITASFEGLKSTNSSKFFKTNYWNFFSVKGFFVECFTYKQEELEL